MDLAGQRELLPHYVAILASILVVLGGLQIALGDVGPLIAGGAVVSVVLLYPTVVRTLGLEPGSWER